MSLSMQAEPIPLRLGPDDTMYVGHTRVTLDTVIEAFQEGATAETIAQQYPSTLRLISPMCMQSSVITCVDVPQWRPIWKAGAR
jgi:hypothetical protein